MKSVSKETDYFKTLFSTSSRKDSLDLIQIQTKLVKYNFILNTQDLLVVVYLSDHSIWKYNSPFLRPSGGSVPYVILGTSFN